jgi:S1-C subfamily serine protease
MKKIVLSMLKVLGILLLVIFVNKNLEIVKQNKEYILRDKLLNSSVIVFNTEGNGSGTLVAKGMRSSYILTCNHVVVKEEKPVKNKHGKKIVADNRIWVAFDVGIKQRVYYPAEIIIADKTVDLALICVESRLPGINIRPIANVEPQIGDTMIVVGNPLGVVRNYAQQHLTNKENNFYITSGLLTFGNSGGGLFNTEGELVGVPESVRMTPVYGNRGEVFWAAESSLGFSVDLPTIKKFLKESGFENILQRV